MASHHQVSNSSLLFFNSPVSTSLYTVLHFVQFFIFILATILSYAISNATCHGESGSISFSYHDDIDIHIHEFVQCFEVVNKVG